MISSAIWDKSARVNFSKTKNLRVRIHPKLHEKSCDYLLIIHIQKFTLREDVKLTDVFGRLPSIPC